MRGALESARCDDVVGREETPPPLSQSGALSSAPSIFFAPASAPSTAPSATATWIEVVASFDQCWTVRCDGNFSCADVVFFFSFPLCI